MSPVVASVVVIDATSTSEFANVSEIDGAVEEEVAAEPRARHRGLDEIGVELARLDLDVDFAVFTPEREESVLRGEPLGEVGIRRRSAGAGGIIGTCGSGTADQERESSKCGDDTSHPRVLLKPGGRAETPA
jgi:hypothetical protein